jgi:deazaflavin-dependent oxidoreductase (nitroreductase family)
MPSSFLRRFFRFLNKFFMVPMFRLGFGPFFGNPFTGYIMVLKVIGRKTGKLRFAPVNYAILNGSVYCLAGWGRISDWYRNLQTAPDISVILPGGAIAGHVEEVEETGERAAVIRQILKNGGFAGFFGGFNPYRVSEAVLREKTAGLPLLRIRPDGVGNGASDPGGWAWVWTPLSIFLLVWVIRLALR